MNWRRGLFRLWLVASIVWMGCVGYALRDDFTADRTNWSPLVGPPDPGWRPENKYSIPADVWNTQVADWATRRKAVIGLIAPPIVVPIVGFALFWLGLMAFQIAGWIVQGFRSPVPEDVARHQSEVGHPYPRKFPPRFRAAITLVATPVLLIALAGLWDLVRSL